jgi:multisubunit Na+/H+ antiporter MnhB subunit
MSKEFNRLVAIAQIWLLVLWEGVGAIYFGWSPLGIALAWLTAIVTLNVATTTVLRMFLKLTLPEAKVSNVVNITDATITEEDGVG